jgi:hypothetical protein
VKIEHGSRAAVEPPALAPTPGARAEANKLSVGETRDSSSDQSAAHWFDRVNENVVASRNKRGRHEGEQPRHLVRRLQQLMGSE